MAPHGGPPARGRQRSAKFGRGLRVFLVLETGEKAIFMVMGTPELAERVREVLGA